jgi:hypothetical protein
MAQAFIWEIRATNVDPGIPSVVLTTVYVDDEKVVSDVLGAVKAHYSSTPACSVQAIRVPA